MDRSKSGTNLLRNSESLTNVNPQQAQDLLRRIQKQHPE